jgi:hypothetical protein
MQRKGTGFTDDETQTNTRLDVKSPVRGASKDTFASHTLIPAKLE